MVRKKRVFAGIILFLSFLLMASTGAAHPPSSLDLRYEPAGRLLVVVFKHLVQDGRSHFVKEVKIHINGKEFADVELYVQSGKDGGQVSVSSSRGQAGRPRECEGNMQQVRGAEERLADPVTSVAAPAPGADPTVCRRKVAQGTGSNLFLCPGVLQMARSVCFHLEGRLDRLE